MKGTTVDPTKPKTQVKVGRRSLEHLCPCECVFTTENRSAWPCVGSRSCLNAVDSRKNCGRENTTRSRASCAAAPNCASKAPSAKQRQWERRRPEVLRLNKRRLWLSRQMPSHKRHS